jgi:uncharacterized protein
VDLQKKQAALEKQLMKLSGAVVAFSGGADSTFLLAVAQKTVLGSLYAVTVSSQFVPDREIIEAKRLARAMGVMHICLDVDILSNSDVARNPVDRCYYCKQQMFSEIKKKAGQLGAAHLLHAINQDDLNEFRPGIRAAEALGFLSPLADAGLAKDEIRHLSRQMGLETWDKPSQSCLATRIPHHLALSPDMLLKVDAAEKCLQDLGFLQVRVRYFDKSAVIEVASQQVEDLFKKEIREKIAPMFLNIGFDRVAIDINGYKTGK